MDGIVYFAAGLWPSEGVFVSAVDASTGPTSVDQRRCGIRPDGLLDHGTRRDSGLSPQGYLAVLGAKLIVPSGQRCRRCSIANRAGWSRTPLAGEAAWDWPKVAGTPAASVITCSKAATCTNWHAIPRRPPRQARRICRSLSTNLRGK